MPIKLPDLDNKTFDDLVKEMIASIPRYDKIWNNFNPSDPGITLLEMLCWISEGMIYRTNQIPYSSYVNYLKLVAGTMPPNYNDTAHEEIFAYLTDILNEKNRPDIHSLKAAAQKFLNSRFAAVTEDDFRTLALEASSHVKRVEISSSSQVVRVIIIIDPKDRKVDNAKVLMSVNTLLGERKLLGTTIDVQLVEYIGISLEIRIICKSYANSKIFGSSKTYDFSMDTGPSTSESLTVEDLISDKISEYLDPLKGGSDGNGWPYKRNLVIYELYQLMEKIDGVKYVSSISITKPDNAKFPIKIPGLIRLETLVINIAEDSEG